MPHATDHQLMDASLEALAEVCEDLAPPVYARFFDRHPETRPLFIDELGRGRMLYEIIETCLELAEGRTYVPASIASLASDHTAYGEITLTLYQAMLEAMLETMAELLGAGWTPEIAAAWRRQTDQIVSLVAEALARQRGGQGSAAPAA